MRRNHHNHFKLEIFSLKFVIRCFPIALYKHPVISRSIFAHSLVEGGEALKQMADLKYALDDNVKQVNRFFCHEYILVIY